MLIGFRGGLLPAKNAMELRNDVEKCLRTYAKQIGGKIIRDIGCTEFGLPCILIVSPEVIITRDPRPAAATRSITRLWISDGQRGALIYAAGIHHGAGITVRIGGSFNYCLSEPENLTFQALLLLVPPGGHA